jgi:16S rRNA (uracil1498-N3)-methyltransferase
MRSESSHWFLFFTQELSAASDTVELYSDEHRHLAGVLRKRPGDMVYVTNGRGAILQCRIENVGRHSTRLSKTKIIFDEPPGPGITLALACLKKESFVRAVEQCTELGMTQCIPFVSAKCHLKSYSASFVERLRRVALSAMKQSFRATLPKIDPCVDFDGLVDRIGKGGTVVVGHADAPPLAQPAARREILIIIGPEGGFSDEEWERLESADAVVGSISSHRLRSETAAAAMTAALAGWGGAVAAQPD